jgi:hypothetical protein
MCNAASKKRRIAEEPDTDVKQAKVHMSNFA